MIYIFISIYKKLYKFYLEFIIQKHGSLDYMSVFGFEFLDSCFSL